MKSWKKWGLGLLAVLLFVMAAVTWVGWSLSADISGDRLQRITASPQYSDGAFVNIERQSPMEMSADMLREQFFGDQQREPLGDLPVVAVEPDRLNAKPAPGLRAIWLGHASVLIEIDGHRLMVDPVLSERASPFQFAGPKRFHPPPIALADLAGIDAVLISHDHYDHLDEATVRHLAVQATKFFVPLGVGAHLEAWDVAPDQIREIYWWEQEKFGPLMITAIPNRHYSGRGFFDYKATLWNAWSVAGTEQRFYYSGDTGYAKLFGDVGERLGPFDLTIIKIGSYGPSANWIDIHMSPEDAIQVHLDVGGKRLLPVHWATFNLAFHDWDEPIKRALAAANRLGVDLLTPKIGEVVASDTAVAETRWWESVR